MSKTYFTDSHEWIRVESDGTATVGITDYAKEQLGELVFVELPEVGRTLARGDATVVVESVKAASEVYAPVDGEVTEANEALSADADRVGASADGWLWRMRLADPGQLEGLLDEAGYASRVG